MSRTAVTLYIAGVISAGAAPVAAQGAGGQGAAADGPVRLELARTMLSLTDLESMRGQFTSMLRAMRLQLPQLPESAWDSLDAKLRRGMAAFTDSVAQLYAERFTAAELREVLAFYQSATGRRLLAEQSSIAVKLFPMSQRIAIEAFEEWKREAGIVIPENDAGA